MALPAYATSGEVALKPGFERIEALLAGMDHPERDKEIILVAGTNGKGSTASLLAALSTTAGIPTGLHTSPHLLSVTERMRVDGVAPTTEWLAAEAARWEDLFASVEPSFFEATLALSLRWFAVRKAQRYVVEIGLGGRWDAANVLAADVCILTSVGKDHMHLLGPTLGHVAAEKAAIAKPGKPFIMPLLETGIRTAAHDVLKQAGAHIIEIDAATGIVRDAGETFTLTTSRRSIPGIVFPLQGLHQQMNTRLALEALDQLHATPVDAATVREGLGQVTALSGLRGRGEWVLPGVMVDVAHNEDALQATLTVFLEATRHQERLVVAGYLADKDPGSIGHWLQRQAPDSLRIVCVDTHGVRGLSAATTAERWINSGWSGPIETVPDPADVFEREQGRGRSLWFGGSHQVVSRILPLVRTQMREGGKLLR